MHVLLLIFTVFFLGNYNVLAGFKGYYFSITRDTPARVVITFLFKWYGSDDVEKGGGSWSLYAEPGEGV